VSGWGGYSRPSARLSTPTPTSAVAPIAARIDVKLSRPLRQPATESATRFLHALSDATSVPSERFELVEVSATRRFVTFDVFGDDKSAATSRATTRALDETLRRLVASPDALTRIEPPIDLRFGVRRQPELDGYDADDPFGSLRSEQLLAGASREGVGTVEHKAGRITFAIFALVFGVVCCWPICSSVIGQLRECCGQPASGASHQGLLELDDELEEGEDTPRGARGSHASRCSNED
jgi:hypothetical protein